MDIKEYEHIIVRKEKPLNIQQFVISCRKHWRWFAISVLTTTILSVVFVLSVAPKYERSAEVMIKDEDNTRSFLNTGSLSMFSSLGLANITSNVNNELKVFQSIATLERVIKQLGLITSYERQQWIGGQEMTKDETPAIVNFPSLQDDDQASFTLLLKKDGTLSLSDFKCNKDKFDKTIEGQINQVMKTPIGLAAITKTPQFNNAFKGNDELKIKVKKHELYKEAEKLQKHINISLLDDQTSVINLSYQDISPKRAEDVLNALIAIYQAEWLNDKNSSIQASSKFIEERISNLEKELSALDGSISKFKGDNKLIDYEENAKAALGQMTATEEVLQKLNNQLYVMQHMRNIMTKYDKEQLLPANLLPEEKSISVQIKEYNDLILKRNTLVENSSTKNPMVESFDNQINSLRSAINSSLQQSVEQLQIQVNKVNANKGMSTSMIASVPSKIKQILPTERQQKVIEGLYIYLLQKKEENGISQIFGTKNTRIITPPSGLRNPVFPRKLRTTAAGFLIGLLLPLIVLFIIESRNKRIRSINAIDCAHINLTNSLPWSKNNPVTVSQEGNDMGNNAFRELRTKVLKTGLHTLMVTSVEPQTGKTYVAMNLAKALQLIGKNVAIVDLDLRTSGIKQLLGLKPITSACILDDETAWKKAINSSPKVAHVDIISGTHTHINPADLLASEHFSSVIQDLRSTYDYVIIDTPSLHYPTDIEMIGQESELLLFVLRADMSTQKDIKKIEYHMANSHVAHAGIILNGTTLS